MRWIAERLLKLSGWKIEGTPPNEPKLVAIGAPHTSNWDFIAMLAVAFKHNLRVYWIGKDSLFRWPFAGLFRWLGGIPIYRKASSNAVQQVVDAINEHNDIFLVVAPEGTRQPINHWKTGFYWMAHGAQVPILPCYINYQRKVIGIGEAFVPSGDIEADFARLRAFYEPNGRGRFPEQAAPVALKPKAPEGQ